MYYLLTIPSGIKSYWFWNRLARKITYFKGLCSSLRIYIHTHWRHNCSFSAPYRQKVGCTALMLLNILYIVTTNKQTKTMDTTLYVRNVLFVKCEKCTSIKGRAQCSFKWVIPKPVWVEDTVIWGMSSKNQHISLTDEPSFRFVGALDLTRQH